MRVGIDIDNVLCDSMESFLRRINARLGSSLETKDITAWNFAVGSSNLSAEIIETLKDDSFVVSLPLMAGAKEAMSVIKANFDVVLLTSRNPEATVSTFKWVMRHFGAVPVYHTGDKCNNGCAVIVDDAPHTIEDCCDMGVRVIIFDQPWNRNVKKHPLASRCFTWPQVLETLTAIKNERSE